MVETDIMNIIAIITLSLSVLSSCTLCYYCKHNNSRVNGIYIFNTRIIPHTIHETTL
jgi:hypothetical protein